MLYRIHRARRLRIPLGCGQNSFGAASSGRTTPSPVRFGCRAGNASYRTRRTWSSSRSVLAYDVRFDSWISDLAEQALPFDLVFPALSRIPVLCTRARYQYTTAILFCFMRCSSASGYNLAVLTEPSDGRALYRISENVTLAYQGQHFRFHFALNFSTSVFWCGFQEREKEIISSTMVVQIVSGMVNT